jgi:hypothetical protein
MTDQIFDPSKDRQVMKIHSELRGIKAETIYRRKASGLFPMFSLICRRNLTGLRFLRALRPDSMKGESVDFLENQAGGTAGPIGIPPFFYDNLGEFPLMDVGTLGDSLLHRLKHQIPCPHPLSRDYDPAGTEDLNEGGYAPAENFSAMAKNFPQGRLSPQGCLGHILDGQLPSAAASFASATREKSLT